MVESGSLSQERPSLTRMTRDDVVVRYSEKDSEEEVCWEGEDRTLLRLGSGCGSRKKLRIRV